MKQDELRKITAYIPADLLSKAQESSEVGITETIRLSLEAFVQYNAYDDMLRHKGTYCSDLSLNDLREDRNV